VAAALLIGSFVPRSVFADAPVLLGETNAANFASTTGSVSGAGVTWDNSVPPDWNIVTVDVYVASITQNGGADTWSVTVSSAATIEPIGNDNQSDTKLTSALVVGWNRFTFANPPRLEQNTAAADGDIRFRRTANGAGDTITVRYTNVVNTQGYLFEAPVSTSLGSWVPHFVVRGYEHSVYTSVSTRFLAVEPENGSMVSSSTPFTIGATLYVAPDDYEDGMFFEVSFSPSAALTNGGGGLSFTTLDGESHQSLRFPITASSTILNFATSTSMGGGRRVGYYRIVSPTWFSAIPFFSTNGPAVGLAGDTVVATSTSFTVGEDTYLDTLDDQVTQGLLDLALTGTTSIQLIQCDNIFAGGGIGTCLLSLIVPSGETMKQAFQQTYQGILSRVPIGYITRFITILTATGSTMPPALSYTFGSSSPATLQGLTYEVQLWDHMDELESVRSDDGQNKNIWDIVMPYFNVVVVFAVLFVILEDLMGLRIGRDGSSGGGSDEITERDGKLYENGREIPINDYSQDSEREWQNKKRNRLI